MILGASDCAEATSSGTPPWAVVLAAIGGALLGALVTGLVKVVSEARERRSQSQTAALYGLQEAADRYRRVLIDIGADHETLSAKERKRYDKAESRLGLASDKVICDVVRDQCERWRATAEWAWREVEEAPPAMELHRWNALRTDVRKELRRYDA